MSKSICIHGHFYQPPRENPWLEEIELQDSAYPHRDWNERVTAECYAPNIASRILDAKGNIVDIVNNYAKISFDFGPTLLSWMQRAVPDIYLAILKADKSSQQYFSGHGSALAQCYSHMIMPLANARDKRTQVIWGIKDFEFRFKRKPEGMWLPETAVDIATLEILAEQGIKFTILAPGQARRVRKIGEKHWSDVRGDNLDTQRAYNCPLPSGKSIALFFYDGPISHDVAFAGLLNSGEGFASRLSGAFAPNVEGNRLVHIATDGETYGHHHRFGNMALSYCMFLLEKEKNVQLNIYGKFLADNPPQFEAEIIENSSWSCSHGVERWRDNCGCCIGTYPGGQQKWRKPLREAMDWLRDQLLECFTKGMAEVTKDPWEARDHYAEVVLDRSDENVDEFLEKYFRKDLSAEQMIRILKLLEQQRFAMLMFTSCGWFFDDISGIETVQIMQYAARAMQLSRELCGQDFEPEFIRRLESAPSNLAGLKNGAEIYRKQVQPYAADLLSVGVHFAIASLFEEYPQDAEIYCYSVETKVYKLFEAGKQKLLLGQSRIRSDITREEAFVDFAVLHFGDYNLNGGVRYHSDDKDFETMLGQLKDVFVQNDIPAVIQLMNEHFGRNNYSLWDLFKNEQGRVLKQILSKTFDSIEAHFREIYDHYYPLMQLKPEFHIPLPKALSMTVEFVLNRDLINIFEAEQVDLVKLERLVAETKKWPLVIEKSALTFVISHRIDKLMETFAGRSYDNSLLQMICDALRIIEPLSLSLDLWKSQNIYFSMLKTVAASVKERAGQKDRSAQQWVKLFNTLGKYLKVKVE